MTLTDNQQTVDDNGAASGMYKENLEHVRALAVQAGLDEKFSLAPELIAIQYLIKHKTLQTDDFIIEALSENILPAYTGALSLLEQMIEQLFSSTALGEQLPLTLEEVSEVILNDATSGHYDAVSTDEEYGQGVTSTILEGMVWDKSSDILEFPDASSLIADYLGSIAPYVRAVLETERSEDAD